MFVAVCRRWSALRSSSARMFCRQRAARIRGRGFSGASLSVGRRPRGRRLGGRMTAALRGCQSALSTKPPARFPLSAYGGGRRRSWHVGCCPSATGMEGDDVGSAAGDSAPGRRDARQSQTTLPSGSGCGRKPRICGRRLHARPPRRGRNVRSALTAIRSMRYGPPSGVCALVAGVPFPTCEEEVVVQSRRLRATPSTVKVMRLRCAEVSSTIRTSCRIVYTVRPMAHARAAA
jgi:hypothetical protein